MSLVNYDDRFDLPPIDYDQSKVPQNIKERADGVREAVFGTQNKEFIAQAVEIAGLTAREAEQIAENTRLRQENLESETAQSVAQMEADKDAVIANATVDSEVILARGDKPTLQARLDETTAQLAHTTIDLESRGINIKKHGATGLGLIDDSLAFKNLCSVEGTHVYVPDGTYIVDDTVECAPHVSITLSPNAIIKVISDITVFKLNFHNTFDGGIFDVKNKFDGDLFEISSDSIDDRGTVRNHENNVSIDIKNIIVELPISYESYNYEGTFLHTWSNKFRKDGSERINLGGFWGVRVSNIRTSGMLKYFCRNYYSDGGWLTGYEFNNISCNPCQYMFFGAPSEADIGNNAYLDIDSLYATNIQMQHNNSKHFAYFSQGGKFISSYQFWDWYEGYEKQFLLNGDISKYQRKIFIDSIDAPLHHLAKYTGDLDDPTYQTKRIFEIQSISTIGSAGFPTGNGLMSQGTFQHVSSMTPPIYNVFEVKLESTINIYNIMIQHYKLYDITLSCVFRNGSWFYNFECSRDLNDFVEIYIKDLGGSKKEIIFKFLVNLSSMTHFLSFANKGSTKDMQGSKPMYIGYAKTSYDLGNAVQLENISRGAYIPPKPTTWSGLVSRDGEANHMYTHNERLLYKTKSNKAEYVPRFRSGSHTQVLGTDTITIDTVGITDYKVLITKTNATVGDIVVSDKNEATFKVTAAVGTSYDYLVIY